MKPIDDIIAALKRGLENSLVDGVTVITKSQVEAIEAALRYNTDQNSAVGWEPIETFFCLKDDEQTGDFMVFERDRVENYYGNKSGMGFAAGYCSVGKLWFPVDDLDAVVQPTHWIPWPKIHPRMEG